MLLSVSSFFILSACGGDQSGGLGPTTPNVVIPEFVLDVATDNTNIRLSATGGKFNRLDMSYCGPGTIGENIKCLLLTSLPDTGAFLFTQSHVLDYSSEGNTLQSKAVSDAEGTTGVLAASTTYNFKFDALTTNSNTGVGSIASVMMSATTYDADNNLLANVTYADVSHSLRSFDTSFDLFDTIRSAQNSGLNNAKKYEYTFTDFHLGSFTADDSSGDDIPTPAYGNENGGCEMTGGEPRGGGSGGKTPSVLKCDWNAAVKVSIPAWWLWEPAGLAGPAPNDHPDVNCTYTLPPNHVQALEPFLTNEASEGEIIGENGRRFYGHDVSDVATTLSFIDETEGTPDTEPTLNENIPLTLTDIGERIFAFDSKYTVTESVIPSPPFTPSEGGFSISRMPMIVFSCESTLPPRDLNDPSDPNAGITARETPEVSVNINPSDIYQPFPVSSGITVRTITYRVPLSVAFTKPASAAFGVLPISHSGSPANISASDTNYVSYDFYTALSDLSDATFDSRGALILPTSLLVGPLPVVSQHGEEAPYRFDVVEQYKVE